MKKLLKGLLAAIIILACVIAVLWGREIKTVASVHQVGDNRYLYEMTYSAPYDLTRLVAADIDGNKELVSYVIGTVAKGLPIKLNADTGNTAAAMTGSDDVTASAAGDSSTADSKSSGAHGCGLKSSPCRGTEGVEKPGAVVEDHCTSFQAKNADCDGWIYGRNYDFFKSPTLVLHSKPSKGYKSLAVCDLSHLGYKLDKLPVDLKSKIMCIAAIYAPMDGINEKGLCTSIMALPKQPAQQNTGKHIAGTSILMRLWLDNCATVEDALALLDKVDVRHDVEAGSGYHYMVADAGGDCAVVEFDPNDGWKTMITRKAADASYMHVTNHLLDPKYYTTEPDPVVGNPHSKSWWRYETVAAYMAAHNGGVLTLDEAQECLAEVHWKDLLWDNGLVEDTQYSNVYDQQALTLRMRPWNDYETTYDFAL